MENYCLEEFKNELKDNFQHYKDDILQDIKFKSNEALTKNNQVTLYVRLKGKETSKCWMTSIVLKKDVIRERTTELVIYCYESIIAAYEMEMKRSS